MTGAAASFEYDRGLMALRGRRYQEAEEILAALLKDHPSAPAWCGLGAAKAGLLVSRTTTVDEAVFCFEKARELEPASVTEIEWGLCRHMLQACRDALALREDAQKARKGANLKILSGALAFLVSPAFGAMKEANMFQQVLGGAGTAIGAIEVHKGSTERTKAQDDQTYSHSLLASIKVACAAFCAVGSPALACFNTEAAQLQ